MFRNWNTLTVSNIENIPAEGEEVYFFISESRDGPFTAIRHMRTDQKALLDILCLHPSWHILWQPLLSAPPPLHPLEGYYYGNETHQSHEAKA